MKRTIILFVVIVLVLVSIAVWLLGTSGRFNFVDMFQFGVILVVVGFALFLGLKRVGSLKRGEPAEDELSRRILQKTAAISYYISLYMWVFMIYLKDRVTDRKSVV